MIRKKMILADWEEMYLKELSYGFMEKEPQLELFTFTKKELLSQYLRQGGTADILVIDESFADQEITELAKCPSKIVMSVSMKPIDGFQIVRKYQKTESLLGEIMLKHAEDVDSIDTIRGSSDTRIAVFYSPAGGSGKTALALAAAAAGADAGFRTMYLNLEEIDSVNDVLARTPGTLSDIFLALKTRGMNAGIKLKGCVGQEPDGGFYYVSGVESISEYEEISGDDIGRLLETVRTLSEFDLVVVDITSGFSEKIRKILDGADVIFCPLVINGSAVSRLGRFLDESKLHGMYDRLFGKMNLIVNRAGRNGSGRNQQEEEILQRLPCCARIMESQDLAAYKNILHSKRKMTQIMNQVIQTAMQP